MKFAVPLSKKVHLPLRLNLAASRSNAGIQKAIHYFDTKTLVISKKELENITC